MKKNTARRLSRLLVVLAACLMLSGTDSFSTQVMAKASSYTIKFNANGGKGKMTSQKCKSGKSVRLKKNKFKKSGYSFTGWNTKKKGTGKAYKDRATVKNLTSKSSITLYAQWGKNYSVKFNANGGTVSQKSKTVVSGQKYGALPTPVRNGYNFKGWYTKKSGGKKVTSATTVKLKKKQTLYAHWQIATYKITYHLNGGVNAAENPASYKVTSDSITLKSPSRTGYTFGGWYTDSRFTGSISAIAKGSFGDLNLYAKWTPVKYSITYHLDGGRNSYYNPSSYTVETSRTLRSPSKTGYRFDGWFTDSNFTSRLTSIVKGTTGNLDLYAKWTLITYTVTYELDGGVVTEGSNPTSYTYISGPHTLYPAEKRGYIFNGWRVGSRSGYYIDSIEKNDLHEDLTLYADFEAIHYEVTYNLDGGTNHPNNPSYYTIANTDYILRDAAKEGYEFKGWYTDSELTQQITGIHTDDCSELELYASWEKIPVTRLQYVKAVNQTLGFSVEQASLPTDEDGNIRYSFEDIRELAEEDILAIEAAVIHGVIEVPDSAQETEAFFYPEKAATRDFAAYAAVNALGFIGSDEIVCADAGDIEHPLHAAIAVNQNLLTLDASDCFRPDSFLQEDEEAAILDAVKAISDSEPETLETFNNITYADQAIVLADLSYTIAEAADGETTVYTITADKTTATEALSSGDIVRFPANDDHPGGFAAKIISSQTSDSGVTLTAEKPDHIADVLSEVDISGYGTIENPELITVDTPEGIEASYDPNGTIEDVTGEAEAGDAELMANHDISGEVAIPGTINFKFSEAKITDNTSLNGSIEVSVPSIAYRLNMDIGWTRIALNDLYLAVTEKVDMKADVTTTISGGGIADEGAIEIGRVPVPLGPSGFSIDLVFWFNYGIEGNASITYTLEATQGIQYVSGNLRVIKDCSSSLSAEACGTFEAGPKLSLMLTYCEIFDLADITGDIGGGVQAGVDVRDSGLVCADLGTYVYLNVSAGENSLIGDLLNLSYVWDIWSSDNSPYRKNFHMEGEGLDLSTWGIVEECTYGDGNLSGSVIMADSRNPIPGAAVRIYKSNGQLLKTLYSDSSGSFSTDLAQGDYTVAAWAKGFLSHQDHITIAANSNVYLDTALMVDTVTEGSLSTISGEILDSITGEPVSGAALSVYRGYNNSSGEVLLADTTDGNGRYALTLPCGSYTLSFAKSGYINTIMNITVSEQPTINMNGEMTRLNTDDPEGMLRIVLTWGEYPEDLDSHLVGPTKDGNGRFHVYYGDKNYYYGGNTIVNLDRDDTTSYGPETTAVYSLNPTGTYSFYVHDYTNYSGSYSEMSFSSAKVKVYYSGSLINTFQVPYNQTGTLWHVFDFDAASKTITPRNIMTTDSYGSLYDSDNGEASDLELLFEDIKKNKK